MQLTHEHSTSKRLLELISNLKELHQTVVDGKSSTDLCPVGWVTPISVLPLAVYANHHNVLVNCTEQNPDIQTYLEAISFQQGTTRPSKSHKNHLPITRLSCSDEKGYVLSTYEDLILSNLPEENREPSTNSLKLLTSEIVANIREHAKVDDYWILAQYWDRMRTCEIAMCDTGIGYRESYRGTPYEVRTHIDAIRNALEGKSSKPPIQERGTGIPTIVRMFVEGYGGEVIVLSGDSLLYIHKKESIPYQMGLDWQGSFVGIRFKLKSKDVMYQYLDRESCYGRR
jgi:anti-sigma regulatory factor (Ser/Thr protein kinase)